ncbi:MAG: hypothetical protein GC181_14470 [Bacteroidetes bacterium]|nr:hypothetical protein [Bacteroidota bacterium]
MRNIILFLVALNLLSACSGKKEYHKTASGLSYRFITENPVAKAGKVGDFYFVNLTLTTLENEKLMQDITYFERHEPVYPGDVHEGLSLLHVGDSVEFLLNADSFFRNHGLMHLKPKALTNPDDKIKLYIGVLNILNPYEHFVVKCEEEVKIMEEFVKRKDWKTTLDSTGIMYEFVQLNPSGVEVITGDSVEISYIYYPINENGVTRTKPGETWKYLVGDDKFRVSGLNRLLEMMHADEKIRAVIPFSEAFGEEGFEPMIPPYTALIMELEVKKVIKPVSFK